MPKKIWAYIFVLLILLGITFFLPMRFLEMEKWAYLGEGSRSISYQVRVAREQLAAQEKSFSSLVMFGDSTFYQYPLAESEAGLNRTVPELLEETLTTHQHPRLPSKVVSIFRDGFKTFDFYYLSHLIPEAANRPSVALIILNFRSFCWWDAEGWSNPTLQRFLTPLEYARVGRRDAQPLSILEYLLFSADNRVFPKKSYVRDLYGVFYWYRDLYTQYGLPVASFPKKVPVRAVPGGDAASNSGASVPGRLPGLDRPIPSDHPLIFAAIELGKYLRTIGVMPIFYITPIDYFRYMEILGPNYGIINENLLTIRSTIQANGFSILDYHDMINEEEVFYEPLSHHLSYRGKQQLVTALVRDLRSIVEPSAQ